MPARSPNAAPKPEHRVVVLTGKERLLRDEHTAALRDALRDLHGEVDVVRFDGLTCQPAEVLDECRSFGLVAAHKLVVIDDAERLIVAETRPMFERYCEAPPDSATLVLRTNTWRAGNLDKAIKQVGTIVKCEPKSDHDAASWAMDAARDHHKAELGFEAAAGLVERIGPDLGRIDSELGKLAAHAAGEGRNTIELADVEAMVGKTREQQMWSVQAELLSGDPALAVGRVREILGSAPRDVAVPVLFAMNDLARKLHAAACGLERGESPGTLMKELRMWGDSGQLTMRAARRLGSAGAARLVHALVEADRLSKSSGATAPGVRMDVLAVRTAAALSARG